jgi:hypothetical protein
MSLAKSLCQGIQISDIPPGDNSDEDINPVAIEQEDVDVWQDKIAQDVWDHYQHVCKEHYQN